MTWFVAILVLISPTFSLALGFFLGRHFEEGMRAARQSRNPD